MWDRIINFVYATVRSWSNVTFIIIAGILITLGFFFVGNFLKANKKEEPKVVKPSRLLWAIVILVVFVVLVNIRY